MEHLREWGKLHAEFEATKDEGPILKEWAKLCEEFGTVWAEWLRVCNAEPDKEKLARRDYIDAKERMEEFKKRFFPVMFNINYDELT